MPGPQSTRRSSAHAVAPAPQEDSEHTPRELIELRTMDLSEADIKTAFQFFASASHQQPPAPCATRRG